MRDERERLIQAARQLIETETILGGEFLPQGRNPPGGVQAAPAAMTAEQKAQALKALDDQHVRNCTRCRLCENRSQTVLGEGNPDADLVFVGEGPGEEEDRQGRPFVGRAGQLLTRMIRAMGLRREDVYICNLIKCRAPGNRTPTPEEVQACWGYLMAQFQILAPKVIVALGNPATQNLLNTKVGITKMRGQWQALPPIAEGLGGIAVMPTFHPAYLLRQYTDANRRKVWDDLQKVMDQLGLKPPKKNEP